MPRIDTQVFYRRAIERYGPTPAGVHWNSADSQTRRFAALRRLLPAQLSALILVDVGCGFGDFYRFLAQQDALPRRYIGVDAVAEMVAIARERTGCEIMHRDALHDPLPCADYYVCSGAMNTLTREETYRFIERCLAASRCGFVFNLLRGPDRCSVFNYRQPEEILAWAKALGAVARLEEGYLCDDFAVALEHLGLENCLDQSRTATQAQQGEA